jgi:hypothetical protein
MYLPAFLLVRHKTGGAVLPGAASVSHFQKIPERENSGKKTILICFIHILISKRMQFSKHFILNEIWFQYLYLQNNVWLLNISQLINNRTVISNFRKKIIMYKHKTLYWHFLINICALACYFFFSLIKQ